MAITHVWSSSVKPSGLASFPADLPITISGPEGIDIEAVLLGGATATVFLGSVDNTKIVSFAAHSSASSVFFTTPSQSINLGTAKVLGWHNQMPATSTNPITTTISKVVADNSANTVSTTFRMAILLSL